ncbi:hypothetical protein DL96DRAFT_1616406 [Flagelloscypha sp. PMI_526]|nr:hypothetical protein DL96DRAFT_1616406 [Flagelloscypha sp. PMI_526]
MSIIFVTGRDPSAPKASGPGLGEGLRYISAADPTEFIDVYANLSDSSVSLDSLGVPHEVRLYSPITTLGSAPSGPHSLFVVTVETKDTDEARDEFYRCNEEEHVHLLAKIPGFIRSRRYQLEKYTGTTSKPHTYLTLYEVDSPKFVEEQGLVDSTMTPWFKKVVEEAVVGMTKGVWVLQS